MRRAGELRIALLAHSTNPRGGVVHTLELGDALTRLGHRVTLFAPDATGQGFFRPTLCETRCIPVAPADENLLAMVQQRVEDYLDYFETSHDDFDVWHAQDGISGNVLATLKTAGRIESFVRTVHHVDDFADARVAILQRRSIESADALLTVSTLWRDWLWHHWRRDAGVVGNGVDTRRFSPIADATDLVLREQLGLGADAPVFLAVGGVEERKNTLQILEAFKRLFAQNPSVRLVIAGGASLLDHSAYQMRFSEALAESGLPNSAVLRTGPLTQALMPALYRMAQALVFPSVKEGFGLVVLEAMASGTPAIVSRMAPFTEYLAKTDVLWCEPDDPASIANAMQDALNPQHRKRFHRAGIARAAMFDWSHVAKVHLGQYALIKSHAMPEMRFNIRWPDGSVESCYSPSLVIKDYFVPGTSYRLADFLDRSRTALTIASDRVRAKYGKPCSRALKQRARIEDAARAFVDHPHPEVNIISFEE